MYKYVLSFFLTVGLSVSSLGATKAVMVDAATNEIVVPTVTDLFSADSDNMAAIRNALGMNDVASMLTFNSVRYPGVTTVPGAILELAETNLTGPNPTDGTGKVHWSQIYGVSLAGLGEGVPIYLNGWEVVDTWGLNFIDSDTITVTRTQVTDAPYAITFDLATGYKDLLNSLTVAASGTAVFTGGINTPFVGSIEGAKDYVVLTPLIKKKAPTPNTPVVILNGPTERIDYGFDIANGYEVKGRVRPNSIHITGNINAPESQYPVASISYSLQDGIRLYNNVLITGQVPRETGSTATITRAPSLSIGPNSQINFLKYVDAATLDPASIQKENLYNVGWSISQYETGGNTLLSIGRYHPTTSYGPAMKITTAGFTDGQVQFTNTPTAEGYKMWHEGNDGASSGLDADTVRGLQPNDLFVLGDNVGGGTVATEQEVTGKKVFTKRMEKLGSVFKIVNPSTGNGLYTNSSAGAVYVKVVFPRLPVLAGFTDNSLYLTLNMSVRDKQGIAFSIKGLSTTHDNYWTGGPYTYTTEQSGRPDVMNFINVYHSTAQVGNRRVALLIGPIWSKDFHFNIDSLEVLIPPTASVNAWQFAENFEVSFYKDSAETIFSTDVLSVAGLSDSASHKKKVTAYSLVKYDMLEAYAAKHKTVLFKQGSFSAALNTIYNVRNTASTTITLPNIVGPVEKLNGSEIVIQNTGTGTVTLSPSGGATIMGDLTSFSLGKYDSIVLTPVSNGGTAYTWLIY